MPERGIWEGRTKVTAAESTPASITGGGSRAGHADRVRIEELRLDLCVRVDGPSSEHVAALAGLAAPLPPIVVQRESMRVVDGLHRLLAARAGGAEWVEVTWVDGGEVEGLLLAVRLNSARGMPLSRRDRAAAVEQLLRLRPQWSDRRIATALGVAHRTVGAVRRRSTGELARSNSTVGLDDRVRPRDAASGRRRAAQLIADQPDASLRAVGAVAGLSPATVLDVRRRLERGEDPVPVQLRSGDPGDERQQVRRARTAEAADPGRSLDLLRDDPSLRYTETGRVLLRLLIATIALERPERLVAGLPAHSRAAAATLARECARRWQRIAAELDCS
jgi:hypothetical protein